ncbi:hypothetical protein ACNKHM_05030 [Shigella sonnei]
MKLIIKLFRKSPSKANLYASGFKKSLREHRNVLKRYDETLAVVRHWDNVKGRAKDENQRLAIRDALTDLRVSPSTRSGRRAYRHARYFRESVGSISRSAGRQNLLRTREAPRQTSLAELMWNVTSAAV